MISQTQSKTPEITATTTASASTAPRQAGTKTATLVAMLVRAEGATLDQLVSATGWQPHTTRAALTRLKARGYVVTSVKIDGVRTYRASGPDAS